MKTAKLLSLMLFFVSASAMAGNPEANDLDIIGGGQDTINKLDANNKRIGYWIITGKMKPRARYGEEQKIEEGPYQTSRKLGLWKKYYPNEDNSLQSEITYTRGRPNGPYVVYYANGTIEEKGVWMRNKNIKSFERNYEDGKPQQRFKFTEDGKRNGEQEYFHPNGKLAVKVNMVDGKESGLMERYWPSGELKMRANFVNGELDESSIKYFEPTEPVAAPVIKPNPPKLPKVLYTDNWDPNGSNILYNANKQMLQSGKFESGRLSTGKVYNYDADGLLIDIDVYKEGVWSGKAVTTDDKK